MGAWSEDAFGNDTACDWAWDLERARDLGFVQQTLDGVLDVAGDYLDADAACEGLAACEVVARLKGNFGLQNSSTETVDQWVKAHPAKPSDALVKAALAVIDRILTPPSELLELWEEGDARTWRASVGDLRERIRK